MVDWNAVLDDAAAGSDTQLARFVSAIEANKWPALAALGQRLSVAETWPVATRVGITGSAGAGKSTLVAALSSTWPGQTRVGALAIDPSSEVSGGAVLGDRLRLYNNSNSSQGGRLYLRSMGARGSMGAISRHIGATASLLECLRFDPVIVETAGAGQSDIGIRSLVDCLVLVLNPENGDVIQMIKAGLMEWADVYVVNKSDREGAQAFASQLRGVIARQGPRDGVPAAKRVHLVRATEPTAPEMQNLSETLRAWPGATQAARQRSWSEVVERLVEAEVVTLVRSLITSSAGWAQAVDSCRAGQQAPPDAARLLLMEASSQLSQTPLPP